MATRIGALTQSGGTVMQPGEMSKGTVLYGPVGLGHFDMVDPTAVVEHYSGFTRAHSDTEPQLLEPLPDELSAAFLDARIAFRPGDWDIPTGQYL